MAYELLVPINLYADQASLGLRAQLVDSNDVAVGSLVTTGFRESGEGQYEWLGVIPSGFVGKIIFSTASDAFVSRAIIDGTDEEVVSGGGAVPTPVASTFFSAADLRDYIDVEPDQDWRLQGLADTVLAQWEKHTGRLWARRVAHELYVDVSALKRTIWLPLYPIESLTIHEYPSGETYGGAGTALVTAAGRYSLTASRGRIDSARAYNHWMGGQLRLLITGGLTVPPADVRNALITQARFLQRALTPEAVAVNSNGFAKGSSQYREPNMHPLFEMTVQAHMRHV